jgi:hypothetical protein
LPCGCLCLRLRLSFGILLRLRIGLRGGGSGEGRGAEAGEQRGSKSVSHDIPPVCRKTLGSPPTNGKSGHLASSCCVLSQK